jgi:hypothetical protein
MNLVFHLSKFQRSRLSCRSLIFGWIEGKILYRGPCDHSNSSNCLEKMYMTISLSFIVEIFRIKIQVSNQEI